MKNTVHVDLWDVRSRLADFGLEPQPLRDCARRGYWARSNCTPNHPPLYAPLVQWAETVRALREYTLPMGWSRRDDSNYSRVVDPAERIAIAVATGDDNTGIAQVMPTTRAAKVPSTIEAVEINSAQLLLFPLDQLRVALVGQDPATREDFVTWLLLVFASSKEIRSELSLPMSMGADGYIDGWRERIILPASPLDPDIVEPEPSNLPDLDVPVRRRRA